MDAAPEQLEIAEIMVQVPILPTVMVTNLWGGPPQRMFLKKDLELLPWEKSQ